MFLKRLDLTTALRPSLLPSEVLLFTQDNVGLYEDKCKIANYQNGQVYLTSHRICFIENEEPRKNCTAIDLKDVERYEFYSGFLKSSPKIILIPKRLREDLNQNWTTPQSKNITNAGISSLKSQTSSSIHHSSSKPKPSKCATWICQICTFSNLVPLGFDPTTASERTPVAPCSTCGVKPQLAVVLKAAISNVSRENQATSSQKCALETQPFSIVGSSSNEGLTPHREDLKEDDSNSFQCPRCTFLNHPSLMACELCDATLIYRKIPSEDSYQRAESPGPIISSVAQNFSANIKISFRGGGEKIFYERLKSSMIQRKWLLNGAPPVPKPDYSTISNSPNHRMVSSKPTKTGGIAGLEARRLQERQRNERVIGSAFEDLEALMNSAQEILELAQSFASTSGNLSSDSDAVASALGLVTTKEMTSGKSESLYITELTRTLIEFLTDDSLGILSKAGGIISLVDLWAKFNRARGGVELVSPNDFAKAAHQWEILKLPFRLRKFKSGVLVIQGNEHNDLKINASIKSWLDDLHAVPPDHEVPWDWHRFGRAVTAQEAAEKFGWSLGVAEEELEMAEEAGTLCREDGLEGTRFWINYLNPVGSHA